MLNESYFWDVSGICPRTLTRRMVTDNGAETALFNRWYACHWWYTKSAAILSLLHYSVLKTKTKTSFKYIKMKRNISDVFTKLNLKSANCM